jgi:hypothetical protein
VGVYGVKELGDVDRKLLVLGNYPTIAQEIVIVGPAEFARGDVVVADESGAVELASKENISGAMRGGVICDDIAAGDGENVTTTMYVKGAFSRGALNFAEGTAADDVLGVLTAYGLLIQETRV